MFKLNDEYLMLFLCWAFHFIMQLFDMKPLFWNTAISFRYGECSC